MTMVRLMDEVTNGKSDVQGYTLQINISDQYL